jgi:hypothetical protein
MPSKKMGFAAAEFGRSDLQLTALASVGVRENSIPRNRNEV